MPYTLTNSDVNFASFLNLGSQKSRLLHVSFIILAYTFTYIIFSLLKVMYLLAQQHVFNYVWFFFFVQNRLILTLSKNDSTAQDQRAKSFEIQQVARRHHSFSKLSAAADLVGTCVKLVTTHKCQSPIKGILDSQSCLTNMSV